LDDSEPLKVACQHFIDCIDKEMAPRSSGIEGHEVVSVLEASIESIKEEGKMIMVTPIGLTT
jgi:hypothetical protein